jgi:type IV pilus assembly protein PilV
VTHEFKIAGPHAGFSLIEVLISLLVISVGLLSIASLQVLSKRSNFDAAQRTTAAHLADDLLSRMRSNPSALIDYLPAQPLGSASQGPPAVICTEGVVCTGAELAAYDLWQWEQQLDGMETTVDGGAAGGIVLPTACISGPGFGGNGTYSVSIAWRGLTEATNPITNDCGEGSGNYGDGDEYRRVLVVRTFLSAS